MMKLEALQAAKRKPKVAKDVVVVEQQAPIAERE